MSPELIDEIGEWEYVQSPSSKAEKYTPYHQRNFDAMMKTEDSEAKVCEDTGFCN
jgi:hypothetical protein